MFPLVISGQPLSESIVATIKNVTSSVLNGTDPVFLLLSKRMKCVFRDACKFVFTKDENKCFSPPSMKTGHKGNIQVEEKNINSTKFRFNHAVGKVVNKFGFNYVEDDLLDATYLAYKVISHCISLYGDGLLCPIFQTLSVDGNNS